jgi:hypothetical protein
MKGSLRMGESKLLKIILNYDLERRREEQARSPNT